MLVVVCSPKALDLEVRSHLITMDNEIRGLRVGGRNEVRLEAASHEQYSGLQLRETCGGLVCLVCETFDDRANATQRFGRLKD